MIAGRVGDWEINWKSVPRGNAGSAHVEVRKGKDPARVLEVRWSRDADGIWLELPGGARGFDIDAEKDDEGRWVFQLSERGGMGRWQKLAFLRGGEAQATGGEVSKKKGVRIRAQMPGKIIRVAVKAGATVEKDQPLAVMEAMKMENEIRAPQAGKLAQVKAVEGQAVETGADLFLIEPV